MASYTVLFLIFIYFSRNSQFSVRGVVFIALTFRLLFFFSIPVLSDDIYRFIWDGKLLHEGIHPFAHVPSWFVNNDQLPNSINIELYGNLNSPEYFTIYPPMAQVLFWLSTFSKSILGSVIIFRVFTFAVETGTILLLIKLSDLYSLPRKNVILYAFNPLVILELTGNLHLESFMIFFLLLGIYAYKRTQFNVVGISMALAVGAKLIPLIVYPVFLRRLSLKKLFILYFSSAGLLILLFWPLYDRALVHGMSSSISLYFQKFEFNASIYYLVRELGFLLKGYNIIATAGPWLSVITFLLILGLALFSNPQKDRTPSVWLWILFVYFSMAIIVHPWYVTSLIALGVLTKYRFPILWSGLIFLSYLGYNETGYDENMLVVIIEYGLLFTFIAYEVNQVLKQRKLSKIAVR
ncbi:MAG: hypothetical protein AAF693_04310 [Bacteroidota bacterium]